MSQAWPVALAIADAACAGARRPAGVEGLLRMLTRYAHEAPGQELPTHIRALAASTGETKAEQEARAFGAALARQPVGDYVARLRASADGSSAATVRGLWSCSTNALPMFRRVTANDVVQLEQLRLAADDHMYAYRDLRGTALDDAMVAPDLLLRDVLHGIAQHGADAVRDCLMTGERRLAPGAVGAAIDVWARDRLTADAFWRLALEARPHREAAAERQADPTLTERERHTLLMHPHLVTTRLDDAVPTLPYGVNGRAARVTFLRACEALVRADRAPVLLSTPTYADGTLDFDDLLARLQAARPGGVGPLDLVQALYRLRATDRGRAAELDLPAVMTVGELTSPGGGETWNALDVVRSWVSAGGLPPLISRPSPDGTRWTFTADPPSAGSSANPRRAGCSMTTSSITATPAPWRACYPYGRTESSPAMSLRQRRRRLHHRTPADGRHLRPAESRLHAGRAGAVGRAAPA